QLGNEVIFNAKTSPHLPVEDMRIANFEKFLEHILRLLRKEDREALERSFLEMVPPEMRRSDSSSASKRANGTQQRQPQQQPPPQQQQQQQQQPPQSQPQQPPTVPPPPLGHPASTGDCRKALGLGDLMPSSVMQIRYTTMYPVVYINNQLNAHMSDSIYLDPSQPIALPPPATSALGLSDHLNAESPFAHLAYALQHPAAGISLRNIRWHYGYFRSVFCGYQLVDWILVNFGSVTSRQQATTAGARLLERGVLRSPHRAQVFLDGYNFYELTEACQRLKTQSPAQGLRSQPTLMTSIGLADVVGKYSSSSNNASPNPSRPESRQGSAAPSVANDGELLSPGPPSSTVTGAAAGAAQPSRTSTPVGGGDAAGAQPAELRNSSNPQPASKLRVRTDIQPSALQSPSGSAAPEKGGPGLAQQAATGDSQPASGQPSTADAADAAEAAVAGQPPKYRRTADIFPESMRRASQRELPKVLGQTRMFALDLDQNHQSTRIEQCLVHLDAVHNPMSCFHLSINWLSCTNYLIEEMVRRWAQVAERCGMRLVEAPRAQDTSSEVNHPFHSPIKITLELPPPPVEDIFDAEWVAEMAHLGDSDSEPEPGLDSEARGVAADSARQEE
ncbi:vacuolar membrane-associated protein iml1, partial [Coemansia spiralis]